MWAADDLSLLLQHNQGVDVANVADFCADDVAGKAEDGLEEDKVPAWFNIEWAVKILTAPPEAGAKTTSYRSPSSRV